MAKEKSGITPEYLKGVPYDLADSPPVYTPEDESIRHKVNEFASATSLTAVNHIYKAKSIYKKGVWLIAFLSVLSYMTMQVVLLLEQYYRYPVDVKIELKSVTSLDFPAVTICNVNPARLHHRKGTVLDKQIPKMDNQMDDMLYDQALGNIKTANPPPQQDVGLNRKRRQAPPPPTAPSPPAQPTESNTGANTTNSGEQDTTESGINPTVTDPLEEDITTTTSTLVVSGPAGQQTVDPPVTDPLEEDITTPTSTLVVSGPAGQQTVDPPVTDPLEEDITTTTSTLVVSGPAGQQTVDPPVPTAEEAVGPPNPTSETGVDPTEPTGSEGLGPKNTPEPTQEGVSVHEIFDESGSYYGSSSSEEEYDDEYYMNLLKSSTFNKWDIVEGNTLSVDYYEQSDISTLAVQVYALYAASNENDDEFAKIGHQLKDLLISCKWRGLMCSPRNFTRFTNPRYGNCFTFNSGRGDDSNKTSLTTNFAGPDFGLELELNIEQTEYIDSLAHDAGVRVVIHGRNVMPFPGTEGFSISPGQDTIVGLKETKFLRLGLPHGNCTHGDISTYYSDMHGVNYSKAACIQSCYQTVAIERCGCAMPGMAFPNGTEVCDVRVNETGICMHDFFLNVGKYSEKCEEKCPNECSETKYEITMSSSMWPSGAYMPILDSKVMMSTNAFLSGYDTAKRATNFAKLRVYFQEMTSQVIEANKAYEVQNVVSDVGGQLGLWLGLSAITIGELLEFMIAISSFITARTCWKKKGRGTTQTKVQPFTNPRLEDI